MLGNALCRCVSSEANIRYHESCMYLPELSCTCSKLVDTCIGKSNNAYCWTIPGSVYDWAILKVVRSIRISNKKSSLFLVFFVEGEYCRTNRSCRHCLVLRCLGQSDRLGLQFKFDAWLRHFGRYASHLRVTWYSTHAFTWSLTTRVARAVDVIHATCEHDFRQNPRNDSWYVFL